MDSSSDNDDLNNSEDLGSQSEFDDSDTSIGIKLNGRVKEVKVEKVKEEGNTSTDTVGRSSCHKEEKENDDPDDSHPILERAIKGFTAERLFNIIVGGDVPKKIMCKRVPWGVRKHATFVVDTSSLEADIVNYWEDNGSWTGHTKPRRTYQVEIDDDTGMSITEECQSETQELEDNIFTLCRNYFRHAHTPDEKNDCHSAGLQRERIAVSSCPVLFRGRRRSASETRKAWECKRGKFHSLHAHITTCS